MPIEPSHQTVRLSRGKHSSPAQGVCVMELASMLAGEPFSDHPRSVSPVIAGFLRTYNDGVDERRRQDLYRFAADAVGTRAPEPVEAERARIALDWAEQRHPQTRRLLSSLLPAASPTRCAGRGADAGTIAGRVAVKLAGRRQPHAHAAALALVDRLIAVGRPAAEPGVPAAAPVRAAA